MNSDDIFFEDDDAEEEEESTFPDEDIAEDEVEEATFEDVVDFKEIRTYDDKEPGYAYANFLRDPWPPTALIITLIGLGIVLLTPSSIWAPNRYGILGVYFLISAGLVGIVLRLGDKLMRLKQTSSNQHTIKIKDEGLRELFLDMANYCDMGLMLLEENREQKDSDISDEPLKLQQGEDYSI